VLIGVFDTPFLAQAAVLAHNDALGFGPTDPGELDCPDDRPN
jgi:hypothetical protein